MSRPNEYPGDCFRCGGRVAAGEGFTYPIRSKPFTSWMAPGLGAAGLPKFGVQHATCAHLYDDTDKHVKWAPDTPPLNPIEIERRDRLSNDRRIAGADGGTHG